MVHGTEGGYCHFRGKGQGLLRFASRGFGAADDAESVATIRVVRREWIREDEVRLEKNPALLYLNRYDASIGKT